MPNLTRILLIEDSPDLQAIVRLELEPEYALSVASTVKEAHDQVDRRKPDLILLDVTLPDGCGFELCEALRKKPDLRSTPIIFLTGKSEALDKKRGFQIGADDYVSKPFDPVELKARIETRLRHAAELKGAEERIVAGPLQFDRIRSRVYVAATGQDLGLTPFEYRILAFLANRKGEAFTKTDLLRHTLDANVHVNEDNIYTHISALRRKMGDYASMLESIPKLGYRFNF